MTNKDQLDQELARAEEARQILGSALHKEAWNTIEMHLFDQWGKTKQDQGKDRESLYNEMKALRRVKKYYESMVQTGIMAERQLTILQKVKKVVNI